MSDRMRKKFHDQPTKTALTAVAVIFAACIAVLFVLSVPNDRSWGADDARVVDVPLPTVLDALESASEARVDDRTGVVAVQVGVSAAADLGVEGFGGPAAADGNMLPSVETGVFQNVVLEARYPSEYNDELIDALVASGVRFDVVLPSPPSPLERFGPTLLVIAGMAVLVVFVSRASRQTQTANVDKASMTRDALVAKVPSTRFADVLGADEAVEDLAEIVDYLKNPLRFRKLGASSPRGVLLSGPPGCGKTMLARAVAGEAGAAFYAVAGSEFVEMYVGVGAKRVRELFAKARSGGPAIVFIDEVDAIGRARGSSRSNINEERENTLNQLLIELDGFTESNVVVIAATNRTDILDEALLRAGRFDREVAVTRPDRRSRQALLRHYLTGIPLEEGLDVDELAAALASRTTGLVGADMAVLANEAALSAARAGRSSVSRADVDAAVERAQIGKARTSAFVSDRVRSIVAWHEAGHTVCALKTPGAPRPTRVSIVPRGDAGGVTWLDYGDDALKTRSELVAQLVVAFGGRAGESLILGDDITQGASGDIAAATALAEQMVCDWGMSRVGQMLLRREVMMGASGADVQAAIADLCDGAAAAAAACVEQHRPLVEAFVEALLAEDTIDEDTIDRLAAAHL